MQMSNRVLSDALSRALRVVAALVVRARSHGAPPHWYCSRPSSGPFIGPPEGTIRRWSAGAFGA
jgi:hypothetical protein